jgi:hypothetical protein
VICRGLDREPTKASYERFEENPDEEFDHFLCLELGWRSVDEMRARMSGNEWNRWRIFYGRRQQERDLARLKAGG